MTQQAEALHAADPDLASADPEIAGLIAAEERRQADKVRLIPSENYVSRAVLKATGSVLTNKYSEGYPGRRYYEGQQNIDPIEEIALERATSLFGAEHANVQPYSGSPCNLAVYLAFLQPGDTVMGMALPAGGHLTHGWNVSITGRYFRSVQYGVRQDTGTHRLRPGPRDRPPGKAEADLGGRLPRSRGSSTSTPLRRSPKRSGRSSPPTSSHIAGLIAGGVHPSPVPVADVVTTTTHKTLRGPRGAMFLSKEEHAKVLDKAVFPGLQGGPHNHTTAAIAVALREAAQPEFKTYAAGIVANAKALAAALLERGYDLVSGGTDNHLILIDLTAKNVSGKIAAQALDRAGIELNYNTVPFDPRKPFDPSGIRLGTPSVTTRGMGEADMARVAEWMDLVISRPRGRGPG